MPNGATRRTASDAAPFVLILGMHRSGTSCLAGALERCGLHLGAVRRTGRHNARGYFEPAGVVRTHDRILAMNRGSWHRPPDEVRVPPALLASLQAFADGLAPRHGPRGIKDPRLLLVLDAWESLAPAPVRCVGTFREPRAVAASLERRNGLPHEAGLALWAHYNRRLVRRHRDAPFPLLTYDLSRPRRYRRAVAEVAVDLGLRPARWRVWRFVSRRLEHHDGGDGRALPEECAELYAYLCAHSLNPPVHR